MSLLDPKSLGGAPVARALDTFVYKQLLQSAGLDKHLTGMAAMVFTDVLAEAIANGTPGSLAGGAATHSPDERLGAGAGGAVSSPFGPRADPFTGERGRHAGVDLAAPEGSPIHAAWGGVVVQAGERGGYGNAVEVDHGNGVHTLYAHASSLNVSPGEQVGPGTVLGQVGSSGRSTGPHLHLEVRVNGQPVDPSGALKAYRQRVDTAGETR